jgi:2-oxoglutarate dehydrogenase E1 component
MAERVANDIFEQTSFLYADNTAYIEWIQDQFGKDPGSVDPAWQRFFQLLGDDPAAVSQSAGGASWRPGPGSRGGDGPAAADMAVSQADVPGAARASARALMLIRAYRARGHFQANLDPLAAGPPTGRAELDPATYGFVDSDWDRPIFIDGAFGLDFATIREILALLRRTYCSTIGYELAHVSDAAQQAWLRDRVEGKAGEIALDGEARRAILGRLVQVKGYERYLDKKFVGAKRFGLDGAEAAIPALEQILSRAAALGVTDAVLGMAHRGRLNVLSQVLRKPHRAIFNEFQGGSCVPDAVEGSGDVKYHLGASADRVFDGRAIHLSLAANPSHLEISDPVVLGKVRAKQDQNDDRIERSTVLPLLIHGDAAFAGQGVVAECFALSALEGYGTGGSLHFIINNQIGFTTDPRHSRSSPYPSDLAKVIEAPIFHVNGDDPEAVLHVAKIAIEFRQAFHKPAVIDMVCFRLYGHNEGDEPAFTQPRMYQRIRAHKSTLEIYGERLVAEGVVTEADIQHAKAEWVSHLDAEFEAARSYTPGQADWLAGRWAGLAPSDGEAGEDEDIGFRPRTGVPFGTLKKIGERLTEVPPGFHLHPTVQRFLAGRRKMIETGKGIDWAMAEALAFGSLAEEGHPVRLSGQDSERGTFSQRHAVLVDQEDGTRHVPLNHVGDRQARCDIINSPLSEEAVLAFEYGYTLAEPNALVLWEAQFGDFANGAQVVFDQFLASGERKWLRMSGLVCLLPHGYDGQGPEHSSARLERYLQSCAEDNWQVANCTTPANYFHILRRQLKRSFRKPLILMTPKSLLRHRRCKSDLAGMAEGPSFQRILRDDAETGANAGLTVASGIRRVVLCSGKVYYDLLEERERLDRGDVYLLRIEQLYPFPAASLAFELARFRHADVIWCQEEPRNMGAWSFVEPHVEEVLTRVHGAPRRSRYVGRPASASPATGQMSQHQAQLRTFLDEAFAA